jgi:hypothetical protein
VIHDTLVTSASIGKLKEPLIHHSFQDASSFLERAHRYSAHQAEMMHRNGRRASLLTAFSHASFECLNTYLFRRGFLDGSAGLLIAISNGIGTFYKYMILREKGLSGTQNTEK